MKLQDAGQQQAGKARVIHQSRGNQGNPDELMLAASVIRRGGVADILTVILNATTPMSYHRHSPLEGLDAHAVNQEEHYLGVT